MTEIDRLADGLDEARAKLNAVHAERRRALEKLVEAGEADRPGIRDRLQDLAVQVELYVAEISEWERRYVLAHLDSLGKEVAEAEAEYEEARAACRKGRAEMAEVVHELLGWWNKRSGMDLSYVTLGNLEARRGQIRAQSVEAHQAEQKAYAKLGAARARLRQAEEDLLDRVA